MSDYFCPPKLWFDVALDVIDAAQHQKSVADYKANAKLQPYRIGTSYDYRMDVLQQLINQGVVRINDHFLVLGNTDSLDWLQLALLNGSESAWLLAESVDYSSEKKKKFDADHLCEIGRIGEEFIISLLKEKLPQEVHSSIKHVSINDDTLGFDILAPSTLNIDKRCLLEVKTSTRATQATFDFYLSRNEFEVGRRRSEWSLVAVTLNDGRPELLGHIFTHQIESRFPRDTDDSVKWNSAHSSLEKYLFREHLP